MSKKCTQEEAEADFKMKMTGIFKTQIPEVRLDKKSGLIRIPKSAIEDLKAKRRKKKIP